MPPRPQGTRRANAQRWRGRRRHVGIVNSVRQAQQVSGIERVHAMVGGFHLGPAPKEYLDQVMAEIKKLNPDVIIPMH